MGLQKTFLLRNSLSQRFYSKTKLTFTIITIITKHRQSKQDVHHCAVCFIDLRAGRMSSRWQTPETQRVRELHHHSQPHNWWETHNTLGKHWKFILILGLSVWTGGFNRGCCWGALWDDPGKWKGFIGLLIYPPVLTPPSYSLCGSFWSAPPFSCNLTTDWSADLLGLLWKVMTASLQ